MIDRLAIIERFKPSSPRFSVSRRLLDYSSSRRTQEAEEREREREDRHDTREMKCILSLQLVPSLANIFQESNPQILVQNEDGQTSRDTLLSTAAKHVVTWLGGKGRREIRLDSLKRRGGVTRRTKKDR